MSRRELDAAGITDPALRSAYEACRALHAHHGRTYYLATRLLPPGKRPFVHALYGFARYADEIVDDLASTLTPQQRADSLGRWGDQVLADLARGHSEDPIARALVEYNIELRKQLKKEGLLTSDSRVKERKKYGLAGARKRFQFSKR